MKGPVFRDGVAFFGVVFDEGDDLFKGAVVADEFEGAVGADFRDGVDVVTSEEDTEVNKLSGLAMPSVETAGVVYLISIHCQPGENTIQVNFENWFFALLAECEVPKENGRIKAQRVHVL